MWHQEIHLLFQSLLLCIHARANSKEKRKFLVTTIRQSRVSSNQQLKLKGAGPANTTYSWTVQSENRILNLAYPTQVLTPLNSQNLVLAAGVLVPGGTYTFLLSASNINGTGMASVGIFQWVFYF